MITAFLSYARADGGDRALRLLAALRDARREPWLDSEEMVAGTDWMKSVKQAIRDSEALILLVTPASMVSAPVAMEIDEALRLRKTLIPVFGPETGAAQLPAALGTLHRVDFRQDETRAFAQILTGLDQGWDDVDAAIARLVDANLPAHYEPLVTKLQQYAAARARLNRPPELYLAIASLVEAVAEEERNGRGPVHTLAAGLLAGRFPNSTSAWKDVLEAHQPFVSQIIADWNRKLPQAVAGVPVPIVLVVMTRQQASQLEDGSAFPAPDELSALFTRIRQNVLVTPGWVDRYGPSRESWQPLGMATTLDQLVRTELQQLGTVPRPLVPEFIDILQLTDAQARKQLVALRREGCVVIMDVISMCHPALFDAYRRSLLDAYPRSFLVKITSGLEFKDELTFRIRQRVDCEFSYRYENDFDELCKLITTPIELQRYVRSTLWKVLPDNAWPEGSRAFRHLGD
ncbi:MAG: toll/interleukin-1 receptor domain-containing protein [Bryobacteraceae bacterium]|jgi:hypothetical protein